ncbi:type 1 glutamine amidotransferase [Kineosporia sp. J2-2]|uniref:Type 1 glutamine amidotransferase n=1 Tax=Kineosporia corallincola TaxID=2835133 RepID=A0ABS5TPJ7_9ACTN|nr:type 1 glutamine amidotransferase domain-containing protein [Kineosporia corallincola]MBT0772748.1 type 1 glutamine amidotransferase [Kineosporia corallincola]
MSLSGKKIAFLVADEGVEQIELTDPWQAVQKEGGRPVLVVGSDSPTVQGFNHLDKADTFDADLSVDRAGVEDYDGLVLPGGVANPDALRTNPQAVTFVKAFLDAGKPVAAICHAPWTLIEADAVRGRTLTSWPSLRTDLGNAGAQWVDQEVVVDTKGPGPLITSRRPDDLPAFSKALAEAF